MSDEKDEMTTAGHAWVDDRCVNCAAEEPRPWAEACHASDIPDYDALLEQGRRLASGRDDLISEGIDPAELTVSLAPISPAGLDGALSLAAAGDMDIADAAEIASRAMSQFGLREWSA